MKTINSIGFLAAAIVFFMLSSCQSDKDLICDGYWVENDAENSLVKFSDDGRFINIRNPESNINYEIDGNEMILISDSEKHKLKIKTVSDMEFVIGNDNEDFSFFRATPGDYFFGIWLGQGASKNIKFTFAEKNNGYLTVIDDTLTHTEFFTYQLIDSEMIIYKQDKGIDTVNYNFEDELNELYLTNKNNKVIELKRM